ncbi:hypothetical protein J6590_025244 [Homalodisca vitripennis]|nr:hypothetical protein J6590_025244 [Homalodisca vitripennis]
MCPGEQVNSVEREMLQWNGEYPNSIHYMGEKKQSPEWERKTAALYELIVSKLFVSVAVLALSPNSPHHLLREAVGIAAASPCAIVKVFHVQVLSLLVTMVSTPFV